MNEESGRRRRKETRDGMDGGCGHWNQGGEDDINFHKVFTFAIDLTQMVMAKHPHTTALKGKLLLSDSCFPLPSSRDNKTAIRR